MNIKDKNKLNSKIMDMLGEDMIKINLEDDFDIPIYKPNTIELSPLENKKILVLSGGGIKGIAHIGVFQALEEHGILANIEEFAGTSAGSLIIGFYLLGYSPKELWDFVKKFELKKLLNIDISSFLEKHGLDNGKYIDYVIKRLIVAKGFNSNMTLKDLYDHCQKKFNFTTVCWNTGKVMYMNHENFGDLELWKALRMSSAVPIFYTKIRHNGLSYIDGGCIDNYPIQLFKDKVNDVIGVFLEEKDNFMDDAKNIEEDLFRIYKIFHKGIDFGCKKGYDKYTICIKLDSIISVKYDINKDQKHKIYLSGYNTIKKLLVLF
jgi:NTE family protein